MNSQSLARGLAFFSVGLGLAELLAPRQVARLVGVDEDDDRIQNLLRGLGLRELGAGMGLMQGNTATFLWSRVAGDAMDLGLLAAALRSPRTERNRTIGAITAVAGVTALDVAAAMLHSRNPAEPMWRIARGDRSGLHRGDPVSMRQEAEEVMAAHESGHLRDGNDRGGEGGLGGFSAMERHDTRRREDVAVQQFEPGD